MANKRKPQQQFHISKNIVEFNEFETLFRQLVQEKLYQFSWIKRATDVLVDATYAAYFSEDMPKATVGVNYYGSGGFGKSELVEIWRLAIEKANMPGLTLEQVEEGQKYSDVLNKYDFIFEKNFTEMLESLRNKTGNDQYELNEDEWQIVKQNTMRDTLFTPNEVDMIKALFTSNSPEHKLLLQYSDGGNHIYRDTYGKMTTEDAFMGGIRYDMLSRKHNKKLVKNFENSPYNKNAWEAEELFHAVSSLLINKDPLSSGKYKSGNAAWQHNLRLIICNSNEVMSDLKKNQQAQALLERFNFACNVAPSDGKNSLNDSEIKDFAKFMFSKSKIEEIRNDAEVIGEVLGNLINYNRKENLSPRVIYQMISSFSNKYRQTQDLEKALNSAIRSNDVALNDINSRVEKIKEYMVTAKMHLQISSLERKQVRLIERIQTMTPSVHTGAVVSEAERMIQEEVDQLKNALATMKIGVHADSTLERLNQLAAEAKEASDELNSQIKEESASMLHSTLQSTMQQLLNEFKKL